jgi:uncharacterized repeat protein (TIGR03806 family)
LVSCILFAALGCSDGSSGGAAAGGSGGTAGTGGGAGTGGTAGGAGGGGTGGDFDLGPKDSLSEWELFEDIRNQVPVDDVIPFEVTSPLFTDDALKHRFVAIRRAGQIEYSPDQRWQSPVGTIYVKTFAYPIDLRNPNAGEQLIETRLLVHQEDGWKVSAYVYNEGMTDADLAEDGVTVPVSWIDENGEQQSVDEYHVPSSLECADCHGALPATRTLGPSTGMLNRDNDYGAGQVNQIDHLASLGLLNDAPPPEDQDNPRITYVDPVPYKDNCDPDDWVCLHEAARSWLDSNCSHCHADDGEERDKELFLDWANLDPASQNTTSWGVCKVPNTQPGVVDCTQRYGIYPGEPDQSLLVCRIESVAAEEMMAPLGRSTVHVGGVEVIRE